ncbi:hypothetical protein FRC07_002029 [Ceratobasidium sp. 392]|nr:hypothetical protein FRC07_002029 [Ceratobasidium sp. 392]
MADTGPVCVLSSTEVEALLTELAALVSTLPNSLPSPSIYESKYGLLVRFVLDLDLVEDLGEANTVNAALEHAFGSCQNRLKILEWGNAIELVVTLLEQFLKRYPGNRILQKWLLDFVSATWELEATDQVIPAPCSSSTSAKKPAPKKIKKTGPSPNTIPDKIDKQYVDVESNLPRNLHGGAPRNKLADHLVISCYLKGKACVDKNHCFWCIASSLCNFALANTRRQLDQIYCHAVQCHWLRTQKPDLYAKVEKALAQRASGSQLSKSNAQQGDEDAPVLAATSMPEVPKQRIIATKKFFALFNDQGKLDHASCINLMITCLLCAAGVPPSIAVLNARKFLKTQRNLSILFDGLTQGSQPVYTVHVCTFNRQTFLLRGDVFYSSHGAKYITGPLDLVVNKIGVEQITSVVSDDTNATKKARCDLVARYPTIVNLADPCHKLNLVVQDICLDEMFTETTRDIKTLLKHFNHSTTATAKLKAAFKALDISTGLKGIGKPWFATMKISMESVVVCMPKLYWMNRAGDLDGAPEV